MCPGSNGISFPQQVSSPGYGQSRNREFSHPVIKQNVSKSTINQAFNVLLFLYREILEKDLPAGISAYRAKKSERLPTVMTKEETPKVISAKKGMHQLMAKLLCGSGMRLVDCVRLRVKDIDFGMNPIIVRDGKGAKTGLPCFLKIRRHHIHASSLQRTAREAVKPARINKNISCHTLTVLPPTSCKTVMIAATSRNCRATGMSARP